MRLDTFSNCLDILTDVLSLLAPVLRYCASLTLRSRHYSSLASLESSHQTSAKTRGRRFSLLKPFDGYYRLHQSLSAQYLWNVRFHVVDFLASI